jgi:hypothetical protein
VNRVEALTRPECLRLLGQCTLGRVAYTERALPAIRAVTYALVGQHLLLRTSSDGLGRRLDGQVVAFEVDDMDADLVRGWSVVVTGTARLVSAPADLVRYDAVRLVALDGADHDDRVCITPGEITGRRLVSAYAAGLSFRGVSAS